MANDIRILSETPDSAEDFSRLLPIHLVLNKETRLGSALAGLPISVASGSFFGPDGNSPTMQVYGFYFNGKSYKSNVVIPYSSGWPAGTHLFYINGVVTGDPSTLLPNPTMLQFVGIQINMNEILLDIKEPYVRLF